MIESGDSRTYSLGTGVTTLIISNKELKDIMKIVKCLRKTGLLIKCLSETFENEAEGQKGVFLSILLGTLGIILLGNLLPFKGVYGGNGVIPAWKGATAENWGGKGATRSIKDFLMLFHYLTNFEIQIYNKNDLNFYVVNLRDNSSVVTTHTVQKKDKTYVPNFDDYNLVGSHWMVLHMNRDTIALFDGFEVEFIPKEIEKFIGNKYITTNICKNTMQYKLMTQ